MAQREIKSDMVEERVETLTTAHSEKSENGVIDDLKHERPLKLDPHGLPLIPQPSDFKDDPLVGRTILISDTSNTCTELAIMAQMDCSDRSLIDGNVGSFQFSSRQSLSSHSV